MRAVGRTVYRGGRSYTLITRGQGTEVGGDTGGGLVEYEILTVNIKQPDAGGALQQLLSPALLPSSGMQ